MLQGEEVLTKRDELLAPNLRRFLLNCTGFHDKLVFTTEAGIGHNPDSWVPRLSSSLRIQLVLIHKTYIFGGWGLMTAK